MPGTIDHVNVGLKLDFLQLSALDLGTADFPILRDWSFNLANGIGAGQASQLWSDTRTLGSVNPANTENLDLAGGLTNAFGVAVTFTKLKFALFRASPQNNVLNNVVVQRAATNGAALFLAASDGIYLSPGGLQFFFDPIGITITPGTGDLLTVTNSAGTNNVTYDVILIGTD